MMNDTAYGIHNNNSIMFLSLEAAEDYLIKEYTECCSSKDAAYSFLENMIWEESKEILIKEHEINEIAKEFGMDFLKY